LIAHYGLVALSGPDQARLAEMLERYRRQFPHLLVLSPATGLAGLWRDSRDCGGGLKGTEVRNKLLLPWPVFIKRTMDIVLTLVASTVALPLLLVVAASVKLTSPGPLLFRQRRLGRDGGSFDVWKFRTMRVNADSLLVELLSKDMAARREWELNHKLRNDPRMTPAGTFLRKTSLDELPQLWNVLIGDMSLVGPRPIVSEEIVKYGMIYKVYSEVAPGITGLWQVSGRNDTTYPERIQFDDFYVRNWSPWLDLYILARTITVILFRIGAY
jgi:Undecaprenyl-phosphate galactose phosphotransferase WbaP